MNTLVKKYNENVKLKDQHFQENIEYVREQAAKLAEQKKLEQSSSSSLEVLNESDAEPVAEPVAEPDVLATSNYVSDKLSDDLAIQDPWLARKNAEANAVAELDNQIQESGSSEEISQEDGSSEEKKSDDSN